MFHTADDVTILRHFINGESTVELYITENKDKSRVETDFLKEKPLNEAVDELRKSLNLYKEIYKQLQVCGFVHSSVEN